MSREKCRDNFLFYTKIGKAYLVEARCRFHHPVDRCAPTLAAKETQQNVKLTLAGLPRREGSVHCPYYMKTGACKYGATCKSNHPPPGEVMASVISTVTSTAEEAKRERGAAVSKKSVSLSVI